MAGPETERDTPQRVGIRDLRTNLPAVLRQVRDGRSFLVTSRDEVVAEIRPPPAIPAQRRPGVLKGRIVMAPDFDTLPMDVLAAMEGDGG